MENITTAKYENGGLTLFLSGRIDSTNSAQVENDVFAAVGEHPDAPVTVDLSALEYISSAGLRVLLRLKKASGDVKVIEASPEIYDIFEMTGFTEILDVKKAYRRISVDGCEVIGQGSNGKVYRIDTDTIVKVYLDPDSLPEIHRERELARKAFVMGIPTAIPYDVVRVGDGYGSVFEVLNAKSFSKLINAEPENIDKYIALYVDLLKKIHSVELEPGDMPDQKGVALDWAAFLEGHLPDEIQKKLYKLVEEVPENHHMLHGDYHTKNVMMQNGEVLLIDMDTLCLGDPVFEFGGIYNAYVGFNEVDRQGGFNSFLGLSYDACDRIFERTLELYFGTEDEAKLREIKDKAVVVGQMRILRRSIKRLSGTPEGERQIARSKQLLTELVPKIDSLSFADA
ncbi:MAG: phosphotransferase [Clostridia bacterium]|nr:phosphotransferase [Clostridia bacterium]